MNGDHRYFRSDYNPLPPGFVAHEELLASLERINTYNPPVHTCSTGWSAAGLYSGPISVAYLFYKLSYLYPDLEFKYQSLLEWAEAYLNLSPAALAAGRPTNLSASVDPQHCGVANETLAYLMVNGLINSDASLIRTLCRYESVINAPGSQHDGSNEWLYGRAGYLYFLRVCRLHSNFSGQIAIIELLDETIKRTTDRIMAVKLPWSWHGMEYLGAVHGYIGIVTQIMLCRSAMAMDISEAIDLSVIEKLLVEVLKTQHESGNFPSSRDILDEDSLLSRDSLVQFCHGGAGFVLSLEPIKNEFSPQVAEQLQVTLRKARSDLSKRGLLTKPPSICHGVAGNALAFAKSEQESFMKFLAYMTTDRLEANAKARPELGIEKGWMSEAGQSDKFVGLFTGEAGRAWVWAVVDQNLPHRVLGFNDV